MGRIPVKVVGFGASKYLRIPKNHAVEAEINIGDVFLFTINSQKSVRYDPLNLGVCCVIG